MEKMESKSGVRVVEEKLKQLLFSKPGSILFGDMVNEIIDPDNDLTLDNIDITSVKLQLMIYNRKSKNSHSIEFKILSKK